MLATNIIVLLFIVITMIGASLLVPANPPGKLDSAITPTAKSANYLPLKLSALLLLAFLVRILLSVKEPGYEVDINCFRAWADGAYRLGLSHFYSEIGFCDYTPGYIYILWLLGILRAKISFLSSSILLLKMPAIICDLISGYLLFKLAKDNFSENSALFLAALYLFNPVILIDSAMWGQVDSVFTLFIFLTIYALVKEKRIIAYFCFAIGCMLKLQTLVFFPVLLAAILEQVFLKDFSVKKMCKDLLGGLGAILFMYLSILPFHFENYGLGFIELSKSTLTSYASVTVNAYNFWEIFALNWHSQEETIGTITYANLGTFFLICMTLATLYFILCHYKKDLHAKYYLAGAFIICAFFSLSVRVHERYMFPVFMLLLCAYISYPRKELLYVFWGLTFTQAANIWHVLKFYDPANFDWNATFPRIIAFISTTFFGYLIYLCIRILCTKKALAPNLPSSADPASFLRIFKEGIKPAKSMPKASFTAFDWLFMLLITVIYSAIALTNVGDKEAPMSYYETTTPNETWVFDFTNQTYPTYVYYFNGRIDNRCFGIWESDDYANWSNVPVNNDPNNTSINMDFPFCWNYAVLSMTKPYLSFVGPSDGTVLNELVFMDADHNILMPNNTYDHEALFDETDLFPEEDTYMSSTYFDEIYHARTGYEMTEGLYNYEWTHPPFGKILISIGIRLFGMCPYGWRIVGVLIGICMLPPFYYLAKMLVRKTYLAAVTTTLLAADFMHFAQTRIATIDVYVTFFIILMYLFMYLYTQKSFYDMSSKELWPILFCSGLFMGFGCASKWTGIYAGAGLAILFFLTMARRYFEYIYATQAPKDETDGIKHSYIISAFAPNLIRTCLFCIPSFIIVPGMIYTLSYIPFSDGTSDGLITRMLHNQKAIFAYHSQLEATHPFSSVWYEWIIDKKPILYSSKLLSDGTRSCLSAFGNPIIWWTGLAAFVFLLFIFLKKKDWLSLALIIGYLSQLLPWIMVTRCTFIYHYFPSVPFIILMIGYSMYQLLLCKQENKKYQITMHTIFAIFAILAVILFIMYYPVLSGKPVSTDYIDKYLVWFSSWQLY